MYERGHHRDKPLFLLHMLEMCMCPPLKELAGEKGITTERVTSATSSPLLSLGFSFQGVRDLIIDNALTSSPLLSLGFSFQGVRDLIIDNA